MKPEAAEALIDGAVWLFAAFLVWRSNRVSSKMAAKKYEEKDKEVVGLASLVLLAEWMGALAYCLWNFRAVFKALLTL